MATPGIKQYKHDRKQIFKHYAKMGEPELKSEQKHFKKIEKKGYKITPTHAQSVKYHLKMSKMAKKVSK